MLEWQLPLYIQTQAKIAIIEGMKAENEMRRVLNLSPAYVEEDFAGIAIELEQLSEESIP